MITDELLFLETLRDLNQKLVIKGKYQILMASALLRKLIIDKHCLFHKISRKYQVPVLFKVMDKSGLYKNEGIKGVLNNKTGLSYHKVAASGSEYSKDIRLEEFLKFKWSDSFGEPLTVKALIKTYANLGGGVHIDYPKTKIEEMILKPRLNFFETPMTEIVMLDIIEVVLEAMRPLAIIVTEEINRK